MQIGFMSSKPSARAALALAVALSPSVGACGGSSGFSQAALREQLSLARPHVNEHDVGEALALKPQLPKPFRLGVFFREAHADEGSEPVWRWEHAQKQAILKMLGTLRASGEVGEVFNIGSALVVGDDLRAIRIAAARHGADAVLVVSGVDQARHEINGWALAYIAVLPILFAPGTEVDVLFLAHAEMWDVRNEYLYLAAEAESEARQAGAAAFVDREEVTRTAHASATQLLTAELRQRFAQLRSAPRP